MQKVQLKPKNKNMMIEFNQLLNQPDYKEFIDKLNIPYEELAKYTSLLEDCKIEYENCKNCKSLLACKNRITGCMHVPVNGNGIRFLYQNCRYKNQLEKKQSYLKHVYSFDMPTAVKEASMKSIFTEDKNRFDAIKYISQFIDAYLANKEMKGLYLYGSFGSGKTYLINAMFNELAKQKVKSASIFWPEYLRMLKTLFGDNEAFKQHYNRVKTSPLLLIDDLGAENNTSWGRDEILCPILQYRMENHLPTFITSNLDLKALELHFSDSSEPDIKSRRVIERIKQLTQYQEMISKNLRK